MSDPIKIGEGAANTNPEAPPGDAGARPGNRRQHLAAALRLEYVTVVWNVAEGLIAIAAAVAAGSVALMGFGIDSFIESASGGVLIWRLLAERSAKDSAAIEKLDRVAHRLVGVSLFLLAGYVMLDAGWTLSTGERPHPSAVGIILTTTSLFVMRWLARAKRRQASALGSRALQADSFQTTACWWLSLVALGGIGLNALFEWWWADPIAALGMTVFIVREGREAWRGEDHCADCA